MEPPPELMEELVEEALLRIPPDDPARLLRAALVCKRWCRLISAPRFRRRYREFYRTPPILGALLNQSDGESFYTRFVPTTSFGQPCADLRGWRALDARHGRVLVHTLPFGLAPWDNSLFVWDPITDAQLELPKMHWEPDPYEWAFNGAVLCAAHGACDHLDCSQGPFLVLFVGTGRTETFARVYSSEDGTWSEPTFTPHIDDLLELAPGVLVENALYFMFYKTARVLKYDLPTGEMNVFDLPPTTTAHPGHFVLTTTEDGRLGFARAKGTKLCLWSRVAGPGEVAGWAQSRVIELEALLQIDALSSSPRVIGFADGANVIYIRMGDALFSIDLKSSQVKKVEKGIGALDVVVPYMSFYVPALEADSTGEEPRASTSSA